MVLWADDDSDGVLAPLGRILVRRGIQLRKAQAYRTALKALEDASLSSARITKLLADVILPHAEHGGSLGSHMGLELAERAAEFEVRTVVFLTVVRQDEVLSDYRSLQRKFPAVTFEYFDKTQLLQPGTLEEGLIPLLKADGQPGGHTTK